MSLIAAAAAASPITRFSSFSSSSHDGILRPIKKRPYTKPVLISSCSKKPIRVNSGLFTSNTSSNHYRVANRNRNYSSIFTCSASSSSANKDNSGRILFSDVEVKQKRNVFWGRKWNFNDLATALVVLSMHLLCLFAPFTFNWPAFWLFFVLYIFTGLFGITFSFHRNLSHKSFKLPKWLEYFCAYCGVLAMQGNPMDWVSTHRYHHQFVDSERDPHTPIEGFWFSHISWLFDTTSVLQKCGEPDNVGDLQKQPFYRFLQKTYIIHPIALGALLYTLGGFPFIVWGMAVRIVWVYHITWLVNSACHVWGSQSWNTGDLSRNNWWVSLFAFGEGWHNNHHAFEFSARHGLKWWEIDMTWYLVRLFQAIGLATDVKLPTETQKQRMSFSRTMN